MQSRGGATRRSGRPGSCRPVRSPTARSERQAGSVPCPARGAGRGGAPLALGDAAPAAPACRSRAPMRPAVRRARTGGDRRIVTALFADLVDYVRLVAEHDPEEVRRRVDAALGAMVDAIERFDGTREKFIGDAVFAVFGWPTRPRRRRPPGHPLRPRDPRPASPASRIRRAEALQVRIGLATGEVVAAPRDVPGRHGLVADRPGGHDRGPDPGPRRAGRDPPRRADPPGGPQAARPIEDLGERVLRGQRRPVRIGRLLGEAGFQPWQPLERPVRRPGRGAGRAAPGVLGRLRGATGSAAIAVVEGEAGIGKSRLLATSRPTSARAGLAWTWVDNVSYGAAGAVPVRPVARPGRRRGARDGLRVVRPPAAVHRRRRRRDDVRRWAGGDRRHRPRRRVLGLGGRGGPRPGRPGRGRRRRSGRCRRALHRAPPRARRPAGHRGRRPPLARPVERRASSRSSSASRAGGRSLILVGSRPEGLVRSRARRAGRPSGSRSTGLDERETGELARAVAGRRGRRRRRPPPPRPDRRQPALHRRDRPGDRRRGRDHRRRPARDRTGPRPPTCR